MGESPMYVALPNCNPKNPPKIKFSANFDFVFSTFVVSFVVCPKRLAENSADRMNILIFMEFAISFYDTNVFILAIIGNRFK